MTATQPRQLPQLSQPVLRSLGDRSYEKRKQAALEIEQLVKELNAGEEKEKNKESIKSIIATLVNDYAFSTQANHRKGGLIGLAATAIALMDDTNTHLELLLPPVLKCFSDQESRVRYYACEALYNITKVARSNVLLFFNEIFDGLCKLYADVDIDVKNGAQLLDRLIKDVVTACDTFDVNKFIPLLRERIRIKNPFIRQLLVGWITVLDSVPGIDMLEFLPEYLGGLFDMLSDPNKDIRQQAYAALSELLREITQSTTAVELGPMVMILVRHCDSKDNFTRLTVLSWMYEFIQLGKAKLLGFVSEMLGAALQCISDQEKEIRQKAEKTNDSLLKLVEETDQKIDIHPLLNKVTLQLLTKWVHSRLAALRWISMLLTKMPGTLFHYLNELFPALLKTLQDPEDQVVRLDLEVLARISLNESNKLDQPNFEMVLTQLMRLFSMDRKFLETRGSLIIRQLSVLLKGESIYRTMAALLQHEDLEFASLMVQTLNLILLTSSELFELRRLLKSSLVSQAGRDLFVALYNSWAHNPVATFSLCLLAQAYELASALVFQMADIEVTVGFLMQIDKLVQLIESPISIHLRLQLLEPAKHPFLLKSLYGLLMLLPQSSAFNSLKSRLESVSVLGTMSAIPDSQYAVSFNPSKMVKETEQLNFKALLEQFQVTQKKHQALRKQIFRKQSLLKDDESKESKEGGSSGAAAEEKKSS